MIEKSMNKEYIEIIDDIYEINNIKLYNQQYINNEISGKQLLQLFINQKQFKRLDQFEERIQKIYWKIIYLIGEIIFQIQDYLINHLYLEGSLLLHHNQINQIASIILQMANRGVINAQFRQFKSSLLSIYTSSAEHSIIISAYNTLIKYWKIPIQFELTFSSQPFNEQSSILDLNLEDLQSEILNQYIEERSLQPQKDKFHKFTKDNQPILKVNSSNKTKFLTQKNVYKKKKQKIPIGVKTKDLKNKGKKSQQIEINKIYNKNQIGAHKRQFGPPKCFNRNWSLDLEGVLCRLYLKYQTMQPIKEYFDKTYGIDARWSTGKQIELKMQSIVAKVFKKFENLETGNDLILKFRKLKNLIISSDQIQKGIRKGIFRDVATMYQAMLDGKSTRKTIISQKILKIIQSCKKFEK